MDEIRAGRFKDEARAQELVNEIELAIRMVREITLFRILLMIVIAHGKQLPKRKAVDLTGLTGSDRERLSPYLQVLRRLIPRQALRGSLSGWLFIAVSLPFFAMVAAVHLIREMGGFRRSLPRDVYEEAKHHVREPVDVDATLTVLSARIRDKQRDKQPLHAQV